MNNIIRNLAPPAFAFLLLTCLSVQAKAQGLDVQNVSAKGPGADHQGNMKATVSCADGYRLMGGGCFNDCAWGATILHTGPADSTTWYCAGTHSYGTKEFCTLTAHAICMKVLESK